MKSRPSASTKPYYKCLSCPRFRQLCGGIPTRDMTLQEWCEYICDVMDTFKLTVAFVAQKSEMSSKTVEKIRALNCDQDIMRGTARRIELVVLGPAGEHTCYIDYNDVTLTQKVAELEAKLKYWRDENERKSKIIDKLL